MVRRLIRATTSWAGTIGALLAVLIWWAASVLPPSTYFFRTGPMLIPDTVIGADVVLIVDRQIRRNVYGRWTVTVRRQQDDGWLLHCVATGESDYSTAAVLPSPLTLDWWTLDQCPDLPTGTYFVTTSWAFYPPFLPGYRRSQPLVSNAFRVLEVPE